MPIQSGIVVNGNVLARPDADPTATIPDPKATAVLRGRVVSTDGRAVGHAQVTLVPGQQAGSVRRQTRLADEDGQFEFTELTAGKFLIIPRKNGYSPAPSTETVPGIALMSSGRPFELVEGETRERADVSLARWGTMTGRVLDELGNPLQGASVQTFQVRYEAGPPASHAGRRLSAANRRPGTLSAVQHSAGPVRRQRGGRRGVGRRCARLCALVYFPARRILARRSS